MEPKWVPGPIRGEPKVSSDLGVILETFEHVFGSRVFNVFLEGTFSALGRNANAQTCAAIFPFLVPFFLSFQGGDAPIGELHSHLQ